MNDTDKGFVVSVRDYREKDALVFFLGEHFGLRRYLLPGYYSPKSKQLALGLEFSFVRYRFNYQDGRLNRIISGELLDAFKTKRQDYEWLVLMSLSSEILLRFYDEALHSAMFERFRILIESDAIQTAVLDFIVWIIEMQGFTPEVNGCVICGSSRINQFSIAKGGFLCVEHASGHDEREMLLAIRRIFNHQSIEEDDDDFQKKRIVYLASYLEYHSDGKFNSLKLYNDV